MWSRVVSSETSYEWFTEGETGHGVVREGKGEGRKQKGRCTEKVRSSGNGYDKDDGKKRIIE